MNKTCYLDFNVTGTERERLIEALSEFFCVDPEPMENSDCMVGQFLVDKNGTAYFDSAVDTEEIDSLLEALIYKGFISWESNIGLDEDEEASQIDH